MNAKQLAILVRQKRERDGLEQQQVAHIAGVSNSAICRIENEQGWPETKTLERIAHWLNLPFGLLAAESDCIPVVFYPDSPTSDIIDAHLFTDPKLSFDAALTLSQMMRAAYRAGVSQ